MADLSDLRAAAATLAATDPTALPASVLGDQVVELRQLIDGLEGVWSRLVATLDGSGSVDGGTAAFLRSACRLSPAAARSRVVLSRRLAARPAVADTLSAGTISIDHARLVTTALSELAAVDEHLATAAEAPLVDSARRLDPARLRREIAHARYALIPEAAVSADELAHQRRRIDVATTFEGTVAVSGVLDAEGGETLQTALAALSARTGPDDERTPGQRRADALVELCRRQLDRAELPTVGGDRPHLTVLVPLSTLTHPGPRTRPSPPTHLAGPRPAGGGVAPAGGGVAPGGMVGGETAWGTVLGPEAVRRLACDAAVSRVVIDPDSQPLDVGRRTRVVPPAIRTALVVRDRGCVWLGCDRPPQWTDAHHVQHWADGGPTSLDNLVLLCRQHHRTVHEGHSALPHAPPRAA